MAQVWGDSFDMGILRWVCTAATCILAPFAVYHGLTGNVLMFAAVGGLTLVMGVTAWEMWRPEGKVSTATLLVGMAIANVTVVVAAADLHSAGMYWGFAAAAANSFVLGARLGAFYSAALAAALLAVASAWAPASELFRFAGSFALLAIISYVFSVRVAEKERALEELSCTDPLTGVGNRRWLDTVLRREIAKAQRHHYASSLIAVDLDHFKQVNDEHGHAAGDRFLVEFVRMVEGRVRGSDEIFRMGGEEFLILTPATPAAGAFELAEALRRSMPDARLAGLSGQTLSAGIAELRADDDADRWLKRADQALYRAKNEGRDRVVLNIEPVEP